MNIQLLGVGELGQQFDEPAHVGALVLPGQIDIHVNRGHCLLGFFGFVADGDRVSDILDPDLVDVQITKVGFVLYVAHVFS